MDAANSPTVAPDEGTLTDAQGRIGFVVEHKTDQRPGRSSAGDRRDACPPSVMDATRRHLRPELANDVGFGGCGSPSIPVEYRLKP